MDERIQGLRLVIGVGDDYGCGLLLVGRTDQGMVRTHTRCPWFIGVPSSSRILHEAAPSAVPPHTPHSQEGPQTPASEYDRINTSPSTTLHILPHIAIKPTDLPPNLSAGMERSRSGLDQERHRLEFPTSNVFRAGARPLRIHHSAPGDRATRRL